MKYKFSRKIIRDLLVGWKENGDSDFSFNCVVGMLLAKAEPTPPVSEDKCKLACKSDVCANCGFTYPSHHVYCPNNSMNKSKPVERVSEDKTVNKYIQVEPTQSKKSIQVPTPPKTVEREIKPPKNIKYLNSDLKRWTKEITKAVNHLSSNAKTK